MAVTAVESATSSTALLSADSRYQYIIENSDANRLFVLIDGGTASASNYSFSLAQYENARINGHSGPVTGIWAGIGDGFAHITTI